jgi:hypothetical protein
MLEEQGEPYRFHRRMRFWFAARCGRQRAEGAGGFTGCGKRPVFEPGARKTSIRAFYETAGFVKVFVFAFVFSLVAFLLLPLLLPFLDWCIHLGLLSALCVNLH